MTYEETRDAMRARAVRAAEIARARYIRVETTVIDGKPGYAVLMGDRACAEWAGSSLSDAVDFAEELALAWGESGKVVWP